MKLKVGDKVKITTGNYLDDNDRKVKKNSLGIVCSPKCHSMYDKKFGKYVAIIELKNKYCVDVLLKDLEKVKT